MFKRTAISVLGLVLIGAFVWSVKIWPKYPSAPAFLNRTGSLSPQPSPSSQPETQFASLTIPFLRDRSYESQLGSLTEIGRTSTYTTYTTNYNSDGLSINGLLTVPAGKSPEGGWPAVVFVHGYIPPTLYQTTQRYVEYVDYLARNGLVVFKIDLRGHGESEGEATGAYYSSDYVVDVLSARSALAGADFVNPTAIGLWGHSMSGNVVLRSMAAQPDISAAVIWAGAGFSYLDLQQYGLSDASYRPPADATERQRRRRELFDAHGTFVPTSAYWQSVAPTSYLSDLQGTIQLHHAVDDLVVDVGYSRDLAASLSASVVQHEYFEYQTGGHNLSGSSFSQAMQRTVTFFQTHLSGSE